MLLYKGDRLIDLALKDVPNPLVITRFTKRDLIRHLEKNNVDHMIVSPTKEWADTVLHSWPEWHEHNLLLLPDTTFEDRYDRIQWMQNYLESEHDIVIGMHTVRDPHNWGVIDDWMLKEKPEGLREQGPFNAWGMLGFHKDVGRGLFQAMLHKKPFELPLNTAGVDLINFKDVTREWNANLTRRY